MHKCVKHFKDIPGCLEVAQGIKEQIDSFRPYIPLIQGLRNPGMRNRWALLWQPVPIYSLVSRPTSHSADCIQGSCSTA